MSDSRPPLPRDDNTWRARHAGERPVSFDGGASFESEPPRQGAPAEGEIPLKVSNFRIRVEPEARDYKLGAGVVYCESDPNGKDAHEPGAKLDRGKNRLGLVLGSFARALQAVGEVGTYGASKYSDNGWIEVPDGVNRYTDALYRHLMAEATGERDDPDTDLRHAAHAAWNALARLDLMLRDQETLAFGSAHKVVEDEDVERELARVRSHEEFFGSGEYKSALAEFHETAARAAGVDRE